jgi:hypothetical protein
MSTKAFAWFFFVITIINIPVLLFFGSGNQAGEPQSLTDAFAVLSMGNVGSSGFTCGSVEAQDFYERDPVGIGYDKDEQLKMYDRYSHININCGLGSSIKSLVQIGLSKNESSSCKTML